MAEYLELPSKAIPVGLDMLRLNLENQYVSIIRGQDAAAIQDRYFADHFMVIDQMNELLASESEAQAFARVKELFGQLFAPGRMVWTPREKMSPFSAAGEKSYWTESGRGFGIFFSHKGEDLGILELDDLAFEQYKERYLALALPLATVCSMAIATARATEDRVETQEALLRAARIVESSDDAIISKTLDGVIVSWNQGAKNICGYDHDQVIGKSTSFLVPNGQYDEMPHLLEKIRTGQLAGIIETVWKTRDERLLNVSVQVSPILCDKGKVVGASSIVRDITQEKQKIERERASLNAQLQQAQKMESVGRLAGGVAHDYNNMLGVIMGFAEMALEKVGPEDPLHSDLIEIQSAAKRSTNITRQLLAFARKQTIAPVVLDLNKDVEQMLKMLQRLIREDIDLAWRPQPDLWTVKLDPSQIDQILVNLCVNARDAIEGVGKITIETKTVTIDESYCADHLGFTPGDFVVLAVSDNGCGMDKDTLNKIFEPFFTTKGVGIGTGLGLATVYGIVKQNNGFINVYSEPGKGTTFKIYLPRFRGESVESCRVTVKEAPIGRGETVLVVEDEPAILKFIQKILTPLNYQVLQATSPSEAIRLAEENSGRISLLITDVVMPEINGRQLYIQLKALIPGLKCLFMSGYTANVIAHRSMLDEGVNFIPKPFSKRDLAVKVRDVLD
ncbi:MAG: hybrid sensor histidine kinase/response regulator [Candidatus Riflebacteria bacterium HGW-Riflebacteria-1]|nr:MAG: hybrid sensor histidine kinase/response regulator [Candidatus Riflebacteria bacterium HGW-Riflebacteria-1]